MMHDGPLMAGSDRDWRPPRRPRRSTMSWPLPSRLSSWAFAEDFPGTATFLVDTYDSEGGVRAAIEVARRCGWPGRSGSSWIPGTWPG